MIKAKYSAAITDKPWWLAGGIPRDACVAAYQAKGASSLAASYVNLANPGTYNAVPITDPPNWDTLQGWLFATKECLTTGYTHAATDSVIARISNAGLDSKSIFGLTTVNRFRVYPSYGAYLYYSYSSASEPVNTAGASVRNGVIALCPDAIYVDGSVRESVVSSLTAETIIIAKDGTGSFVGNIQAIAIYKATLTSIQVTALTNAMNAL